MGKWVSLSLSLCGWDYIVFRPYTCSASTPPSASAARNTDEFTNSFQWNQQFQWRSNLSWSNANSSSIRIMVFTLSSQRETEVSVSSSTPQHTIWLHSAYDKQDRFLIGSSREFVLMQQEKGCIRWDRPICKFSQMKSHCFPKWLNPSAFPESVQQSAYFFPTPPTSI